MSNMTLSENIYKKGSSNTFLVVLEVKVNVYLNPKRTLIQNLSGFSLVFALGTKVSQCTDAFFQTILEQSISRDYYILSSCVPLISEIL